MSLSRSAEHDARNAALKAGLSSAEAARAASLPTGDTVPAECAKLGLAWEVEDVPDSNGARIHWLGPRSASTVLLYFHGGGFGLGAFPGHISFLRSCIGQNNNRLVVAFLEYSLTPTIRYPSPYVQANKALGHVVDSGYEPSSILIGGDSAGGNMALGLLSSISHPTPAIPHAKLSAPLKGLVLISPWVSYSSDWSSFRLYSGCDILDGDSMQGFVDDFVTRDELNNYSEPSRADASWWKGLPVEDVLVVWGGSEVFRDSNAKLAVVLVDAGLNVTSSECAKQVHIDCVLDSQSGLPHGEMSESVWAWVKKVCH